MCSVDDNYLGAPHSVPYDGGHPEKGAVLSANQGQYADNHSKSRCCVVEFVLRARWRGASGTHHLRELVQFIHGVLERHRIVEITLRLHLRGGHAALVGATHAPLLCERGGPGARVLVGFGRIVVSEKDAPIILMSLL